MACDGFLWRQIESCTPVRKFCRTLNHVESDTAPLPSTFSVKKRTAASGASVSTRIVLTFASRVSCREVARTVTEPNAGQKSPMLGGSSSGAAIRVLWDQFPRLIKIEVPITDSRNRIRAVLPPQCCNHLLDSMSASLATSVSSACRRQKSFRRFAVTEDWVARVSAPVFLSNAAFDTAPRLKMRGILNLCRD